MNKQALKRRCLLICLFHLPDIQDNSFELLGEIGSTEKECIVQPGVLTIGRSLKLRSSLEVETRITIGVFTIIDDTPIANLDCK